MVLRQASLCTIFVMISGILAHKCMHNTVRNVPITVARQNYFMHPFDSHKLDELKNNDAMSRRRLEDSYGNIRINIDSSPLKDKSFSPEDKKKMNRIQNEIIHNILPYLVV